MIIDWTRQDVKKEDNSENLLTLKLNALITNLSVVRSFLPYVRTLWSASILARAKARSSSSNIRVVSGSVGMMKIPATPIPIVMIPEEKISACNVDC